MVGRARQRSNDKIVAIKLMKNIMRDSHEACKVVSEVHILRKLSTLKENVFTTKVFDIILPKDVGENDEKPIDFLFIVMEYVEFDLH